MNTLKKDAYKTVASWKKRKLEEKAIEKAVKKLFAEKRRKILRKESKQWKNNLSE